MRSAPRLFATRFGIRGGSMVYSIHRGVAQPGSAPVWGTGGRRFKSSRPDPPSKLKIEKAQVMQNSPSSRAPHRILIADDESLIRLDLREMLTHLGYEVIAEAGDGRTAVDLAKRMRPDLLIMDIQMPDLDGIAAAEELTREKIAPVVLLTAYSDQVLVERAREAGVVGYVVKPFREAELMPVIEVAMARFDEFMSLERELGSMKEALESRK